MTLEEMIAHLKLRREMEMWVDVKKPDWSDQYLVCRNWMERDVDTSYHQWEVLSKHETLERAWDAATAKGEE